MDLSTSKPGQGPPTTNSYNISTQLSSSTSSDRCLVLQSLDVSSWDHPDDVISAEVEQISDRVKAALAVPLFFLFGGATNCLSLVVFYRQGLKDRTTLCLFTLTFLDLLYLAFIFLLYGERSFAFSPNTPRLGPLYSFCVENHVIFLYGIPFASSFVTAVIAGERCFCIYSPLRSQTVLKTKTMAAILTTSCLLITLGYYVVLEKYTVICIVDIAHNTSFHQVSTASRFYLQNKKMVDLFDGTIFGFLLPGVFITVVVGCTVAMTVKLRQVIKWREAASTALSKKEVVLTKMLIALSTEFVIVCIPNVIFRILCVAFPDFYGVGRYFNTHFFLVSIMEILSFMGASIHFFVYFFVGSKYRQTLKSLFRDIYTCIQRSPGKAM